MIIAFTRISSDVLSVNFNLKDLKFLLNKNEDETKQKKRKMATFTKINKFRKTCFKFEEKKLKFSTN